MEWKIIKAKDKELRGGKGNKYQPVGHYLLTTRKPNMQENMKFNPMKVRANGVAIGWAIPACDWSLRIALNYGDVKAKKYHYEGDIFEDLKINNLWGVLKPYQKKYIESVTAEYRKLGFYKKVLISGLGSGKTLMTLCAIQACKPKKVLVVAPRYLHPNWKLEAEKWGFEEPLLSTYESCKKYVDEEIDAIIFDEMLRIKNPEAIRTQFAQKIAKKAKIVIATTATPTSSKQAADWRSINVCIPGSVPEKENQWKAIWGINPRFEDMPFGVRIFVIDGWKEQEISDFIAPYVYTISNKEIQKYLPKFQEQRVYLEKPEGFDFFRKGFYTDKSLSKAIAQCRMLTSGYYTDDDSTPIDHNDIKVKWIRKYLEDNPDESVIIFSAFVESQKRLEDALRDYDPSVIFANQDSGEHIRRFNNKETRVLISSSQLAEGYNIHHTTGTAIFESLSTSPVMLSQAIGRIKRPHSPFDVKVYYLLCEDTLDERLLDILKENINFSEQQIIKLLKETMMV